MTAATVGFLDRWSMLGARRWLGSLAIVLALHITVALLVLFHRVPMAPVNPPQAPALLDLAPLPAQPMNIHPLPAAPPKTETKSVPTPQPEAQAKLPSPQPQAPAPPTPTTQSGPTSPLLPPSASATEPRIVVPPPPEMAESAPAPAKPAAINPPVQTASATSVPTLPMPDARETPFSAWQRKVIARMYSLNRLPPGMPIDEASATADVELSVDRNGHIVYFKIVRSSGYPELDHAVRSLMRHADPLPPPPPGPIDILNAPLIFTMTIGYYNLPN